MAGSPPDTPPPPAASAKQGLGRMRHGLTIGARLLLLLVAVVLLPVTLIAINAEVASNRLKTTIEASIYQLSRELLSTVPEIRDAAARRAAEGLDERVRLEVERMTTDMARSVARFLYDRDRDIAYVATLDPDPETYRHFLETRRSPVAEHGPWRLSEDQSQWEPLFPQSAAPPLRDQDAPGDTVEDNKRLFRARPPEAVGLGVDQPLYLELTFVDVTGQEQIKVTTSPTLSPELRQVSDRHNTFARAETWFAEASLLQPGEVHVSEMVGVYTPSRVIGPYTPQAAERVGEPFAPEASAYAGTENPLGRRFRGLVRWVTPVVRGGETIGYVTLALDQRHLAAFTDSLDPTEGRYTDIPDPRQGNYAFMLDHRGRTITHPRHYYIVGYDPETGGLVPPWMEQAMYEEWQSSGLSIEAYLEQAPTFHHQSLSKRPALEQLRQGTIAADCRFLNFAPQCIGWYDLTGDGGSGSFQIFWSDVWKLNTAAPIPYYTGPYADSERGFGYITVGVDIDRFHGPANDIRVVIDGTLAAFSERTQGYMDYLSEQVRQVFRTAQLSLWGFAVALVALVLFFALWISWRLDRRVQEVVQGIRLFQSGQRDHRIPVRDQDEISRIADAFNHMAEEIDGAVHALMDSEQRFRATFQQSFHLTGLLDKNGILLRANNTSLQMIGAKESAVIGKPFWETPWWSHDPLQAERLKTAIHRAARGQVDRFSATHHNAEGHMVVVDILISPVHLGTDTELLVVGQDVSERHHMERQREVLIDRLERTNAEMTRFAEITAHHLQEPVRRMGSFAGRLATSLKDQLEPGSEAQTSLTYIREGADTLRTLLHDVQLYLAASQARGEIKLIEGATALEEAKGRLTGSIADSGAQITTGTLPVIRIDRPRLVDVIVVLLENAIKFRRPALAPDIHIDGGIYDEDGRVFLRVSDNGIGIAPEYRTRVLTVFERLHRPAEYPGTGIGLAIVRRIAEDMDGQIEIGDSPSGGTSVTVVFGQQTPQSLIER